MSQNIHALIPVKSTQLTTSLLFAMQERIKDQLCFIAERGSIQVRFGSGQCLYFSFTFTDFKNVQQERTIDIHFGGATDHRDALQGHKLIISDNDDEIGRITLKTITEGFSGILIDDNDTIIDQLNDISFSICEQFCKTPVQIVPTLLEALCEETYFDLAGGDTSMLSFNLHQNIKTAIVSNNESTKHHQYHFEAVVSGA
jgi:hypothetical protein